MKQIIQEWTKWNMWRTAFKQFYFTYFGINDPAAFVPFFIAYIFHRLITKQTSTQNMKFSFKKIL